MYLSVCMSVCVCECVCVCVREREREREREGGVELRIVSMDKIQRFTNTLLLELSLIPS